MSAPCSAYEENTHLSILSDAEGKYKAAAMDNTQGLNLVLHNSHKIAV